MRQMSLAIVLILLTVGCAHHRDAEPVEAPPEPARLAIHLACHDPVDGWREIVNPKTDRPLYLQPEPFLTQGHLADAQVVIGPNGHDISVVMTAAGRERLAQITRAHIDEPTAILLDGKLLMAPIIRAPIEQGQVLITGHFTLDEAADIAAGLRAGADQRSGP